jgi:hypothetical protein
MTEVDHERAKTFIEQEVIDVLAIRDQVLGVLLEKVDSDRYPSQSVMDDVERLLTPQRRDDYAQILLNKVRQDRFPSRGMIDRILRLAAQQET